jgi:hypothetical protein
MGLGGMAGVEEWLSLGLLLFVRGTKGATGLQYRDGQARVRCPKCAWQPARDDRWSCGPGGCGHVWNTFDTRGRCPACDRAWRDTACLRCGQWSPHDDWYESDGERVKGGGATE